MEVQALLAVRRQHRAPSIPDLLIAATAELARLIVLHLDKDVELIASVMGQPCERLRTERGAWIRSGGRDYPSQLSISIS